MVAGVLAKSGYFMGDRLYPARESNPKGFFEDREINRINEALLAQVSPRRPPLLGRWFFRDRPVSGQRWLARIPLGVPVTSTPEIIDRIQRVTSKEPFCFKDPRFSYTLSAWRAFLKNVGFICVFRDPASTAQSILKECKDSPVLHSLAIDFSQALETWTLMYQHILDVHRHKGDWLFLHYNQVLTGEGIDRLEQLTGAKADRSFPDATLRRSVSERPAPASAQTVYGQLCELARYAPLSSSSPCEILGHFFRA